MSRLCGWAWDRFERWLAKMSPELADYLDDDEDD